LSTINRHAIRRYTLRCNDLVILNIITDLCFCVGGINQVLQLGFDIAFAGWRFALSWTYTDGMAYVYNSEILMPCLLRNCRVYADEQIRMISYNDCILVCQSGLRKWCFSRAIIKGRLCRIPSLCKSLHQSSYAEPITVTLQRTTTRCLLCIRYDTVGCSKHFPADKKTSPVDCMHKTLVYGFREIFKFASEASLRVLLQW